MRPTRSIVLTFPLVYLLISALQWIAAGTDTQSLHSYYVRSDFDDTSCTGDHILLSTTASSKVHCATECYIDTACLGFFYHQETRVCITTKSYFQQTTGLTTYNGMKYYSDLDWTPWSSCSATCGTGSQTRVRTCRQDDSSCFDDSTEIRECHTYACRPCQRTCSEWASLGLSQSTLAHIDPLVTGAAMEVTCDLDTEPGKAITVLEHNRENRTYVKGYEDFSSYNISLVYTIGMDLVTAVADLSTDCKQYVSYECHAAYIGSKVYWTNRHGDKPSYFTGSPPPGKTCACGDTNTCADEGNQCNCDSNDSVLRSDVGFVANKSELPISGFIAGDTGAFLIPYVLFLFIVGVPVVYMEMAYCQFSNLSPAKAWICVPLLRGIGIGMVGIILVVSVYYTVIIAWTIYYFVSSFSRVLPWTTCDNEWNTATCYLRKTVQPFITTPRYIEAIMGERGNWGSWREFLLSCIGSLVGLGNIWRFPYLCYKNGGGAFLIPYVLFLFIVGVPVVYMEMAYCQFSNLSPAKAWICVPLLRGIGIGMVGIILVVSVYYTVIIAWTIYYFVSSFSRVLPWTTCDNEWNTAACYLRKVTNSVNTSLAYGNNSGNGVNGTTQLVGAGQTGLNYNYNVSAVVLNITRKTASEEFWDYKVLERSTGIDDLGDVKWPLLLCLFGAWVVVNLSLVRGIKSSGKVMYVAATLPYILLLILLCRMSTLDGALDGMKFYMIPKWEKLASITVWGDAAVQMFYSIGIGGGAMGTLASYNHFHNNIQRDALILPFIDLFTSWFSGCVIFTSLGFMAKSAGLHIDDVVSQGPGIAFLVYPEALSQLPLPQFWSAIFFLMLVLVGLDSQIVHIQIVTSTLTDHFPAQFGQRKMLLTVSISIVLFLLGIPCVTQGGVYILQVMDWYLSAIVVVFLPLVQVIGLGWIYGADRLCHDISLMIGYDISPIWKISWKYTTPIAMVVVLVFSISHLKAISYGGIVFPSWAVGAGLTIAAFPLVLAFIPTIVQLRRAKGVTLMQKIRSSMKPHKEWGPADERLREIYSTRVSHELVSFKGSELLPKDKSKLPIE